MFCLSARCCKNHRLGAWNTASPWNAASLLNWGVIALNIPVPNGEPSLGTRSASLSVVSEQAKVSRTARVFTHNVPELGDICVGEVILGDVFFKFRLGPSLAVNKTRANVERWIRSRHIETRQTEKCPLIVAVTYGADQLRILE